MMKERSGADLLVRHYGDIEGVRLAVRMARARQRVLARIRRDARERGEVCTICGQHYVPRRLDQQRCPRCIHGSRRSGYAVAL